MTTIRDRIILMTANYITTKLNRSEQAALFNKYIGIHNGNVIYSGMGNLLAQETFTTEGVARAIYDGNLLDWNGYLRIDPNRAIQQWFGFTVNEQALQDRDVTNVLDRDAMALAESLVEHRQVHYLAFLRLINGSNEINVPVGKRSARELANELRESWGYAIAEDQVASSIDVSIIGIFDKDYNVEVWYERL